MSCFKEFQGVAMAHDITVTTTFGELPKGATIKAGTIGGVVEIYKGGEAYEVEFITPDGGCDALETLHHEDLAEVPA